MPHIPIGFDITELIGSILLGALGFTILGLFYNIQSTEVVSKSTATFFLLSSFLVIRVSVRLFIAFINVNYDYFNTAVFIPLTTYLQNNHFIMWLNIVNFYLDLI